MHQTPRPMVLLAILGFSVGVEAGNQLALLPLFGAITAIRRRYRRKATRRRVSSLLERGGSAIVSVVGNYYLYVALVAAI